MRMYVLLLPLLTAVALAQASEQTVGGSVRAILSVPPDEVSGSVQLTASFGFTAAQAARALAAAGVREEDLTGVEVGLNDFDPTIPGPTAPRPEVTYRFAFTAPGSRYQEISDALGALSRQIPAGVLSLFLGLGLRPSERAVAEARMRLLPGLVAEVRRRAEILAGAASLSKPSLVTIAESRPFSVFQVGAGRPFLSLDLRLGTAPQRSVLSGCSRIVVAAPDQALFAVRVQAPMTTSQEAVLQAMAKAKIEAGHLVGVSTTLPSVPAGPNFQPVNLLAPNVIYDFQFLVPAAQLNATVNSLIDLRRERDPGIRDIQFSAGLTPSEAAAAEVRRHAAVALIPECRERAESLAAVAGGRAGAPNGFGETGGTAFGGQLLFGGFFVPRVNSEFQQLVIVSMQFALE